MPSLLSLLGVVTASAVLVTASPAKFDHFDYSGCKGCKDLCDLNRDCSYGPMMPDGDSFYLPMEGDRYTNCYDIHIDGSSPSSKETTRVCWKFHGLRLDFQFEAWPDKNMRYKDVGVYIVPKWGQKSCEDDEPLYTIQSDNCRTYDKGKTAKCRVDMKSIVGGWRKEDISHELCPKHGGGEYFVAFMGRVKTWDHDQVKKFRQARCGPSKKPYFELGYKCKHCKCCPDEHKTPECTTTPVCPATTEATTTEATECCPCPTSSEEETTTETATTETATTEATTTTEAATTEATTETTTTAETTTTQTTTTTAGPEPTCLDGVGWGRSDPADGTFAAYITAEGITGCDNQWGWLQTPTLIDLTSVEGFVADILLRDFDFVPAGTYTARINDGTLVLDIDIAPGSFVKQIWVDLACAFTTCPPTGFTDTSFLATYNAPYQGSIQVTTDLAWQDCAPGSTYLGVAVVIDNQCPVAVT